MSLSSALALVVFQQPLLFEDKVRKKESKKMAAKSSRHLGKRKLAKLDKQRLIIDYTPSIAGHKVSLYERYDFAGEVGASLSCAKNGSMWLHEWKVCHE